jgi:GNAT superfamily N-acetyltransferase
VRYDLPMGDVITIREATAADLDIILRHRRRMFEDMGYCDAAALNAMIVTSGPHIAEGLAAGFYRGWLAEDASGRVVAGGGMLVHPWVSHPAHPEARRAYILNVFTEPECRHRGVARRLMQAILDWCRAQGFGSVALHASSQGRALYEALGFKPTNEMRLDLK